ncbi:hypothetical protein KCV01_g6539, partial [Aureobasidium melanogenum]
MHVFVTGATGFVGSAVVKELLEHGHEVSGLVRSDASAEALARTGAHVIRGSLEDLDSLRQGATQADATIHTAFNHDFSRFAENCELDRHAIETLGDALVGTNKPLVVTSGVGHMEVGRLATEDTPSLPVSVAYPRASEATAEAVAARGVNAMVVRLPFTVHGDGDHGFVPMLVNIAREKGLSAYIGEGHNRWPAVHRFDAARVYRLAVERGTRGARYHAVSEEGVAFRDIAGTIARELGLPVKGLGADDVAAHFGWFARFTGLDVPASSARTRQELGWSDAGHPALLDDMTQHYFRS